MKSIGWLDLTVEGAEPVRDFYASVMGWRPEPVDMGGYADFTMCDEATGEPAGGICHARGRNAGVPPVWLVYFKVPDLDESIGLVTAGGGALLQEPRTAGGVRFVVARDPAGAAFALYEEGSEAPPQA
jgi:predicted enzyme related to lactoylglutathione lyase